MTTQANWVDVGALADLPAKGARRVRTSKGDIALFRTASDQVRALRDRCPHKNGPLSQGIVHGETVTCPLHNWVIDLATGEAQGADHGCTRPVPVRLKGDRIELDLAAVRAVLAQEEAA